SLDQVERVSLREKLEKNREGALLSRQLVTIRSDLPLDRHWWELEREPVRVQELNRLLDDLNFRALKRRFAAEIAPPVPGELFAPAAPPGELFPRPAPARVPARAPFGEYKVIRTEEELEALSRELLAAQGPVAFDTETTGLNPLRADLVGISLATAPGRAFYLPV